MDALSQPEIITDVTQATWGYLWRNDRLKLIIFISVALLATAVLFLYGAGIIVMVPGAIFSVWYHRVSLKIEARFMREFAAANGYSYCPDDSPAHITGRPFSVGDKHAYTDLVKGFIDNLPFEYFAYTYTISAGRNRTTTTLGVLAIELGHNVPNTYVQNISENSALSQVFLDKLDSTLAVPILSLSTEFDEHFRVCITPGAETETLQIFEPDLMANLIDQPVHYDFELCNRALYIYADGHITKKADLENLLGFARAFAARFERETSNLDYIQK